MGNRTEHSQRTAPSDTFFPIQLLREGMRAMLRTLHERRANAFEPRTSQHQKAISAKANRLAYRRRARESPTRAGQPESPRSWLGSPSRHRGRDRSHRGRPLATGISALMRDTRTESPSVCPRIPSCPAASAPSLSPTKREKEILCWSSPSVSRQPQVPRKVARLRPGQSLK